MTESNPIQGVEQVLNLSQTGLALAGALGFGALGSTFWQWATRRADQRFLIALAAHEQAMARADKIEAGTGALNATEKGELTRLAGGLREQARAQLRSAVARLKWENSRWSEITRAFFAFSFIFLFGSFVLYLGEIPGSVLLGLVWFVLLAVGLILATGVRDELQRRWIKKLQNGDGEEASELDRVRGHRTRGMMRRPSPQPGGDERTDP
ncbi:hypothetical protein [Propioniciclava soli]|uniref:hypothetical protein n=1 Tax=Propioniciclava soli TaxID=2775081 RepID=UPI001E4B8510|nr:hypothetical protein [Propioniciclava soli]